MTSPSSRPGTAMILRTQRCPDTSKPRCTTRSTLAATVGTTKVVANDCSPRRRQAIRWVFRKVVQLPDTSVEHETRWHQRPGRPAFGAVESARVRGLRPRSCRFGAVPPDAQPPRAGITVPGRRARSPATSAYLRVLTPSGVGLKYSDNRRSARLAVAVRAACYRSRMIVTEQGARSGPRVRRHGLRRCRGARSPFRRDGACVAALSPAARAPAMIEPMPWLGR